MRVLIIDGQGGRIGRQLVEAVRQRLPQLEITAVGTNSMATDSMRRAGAQQIATGENAVCVCARRADVILGPVGIVIADALLGEVTPAMAAAVGQSQAQRILIPMHRCESRIVGVGDLSLSALVDQAVTMLEELVRA